MATNLPVSSANTQQSSSTPSKMDLAASNSGNPQPQSLPPSSSSSSSSLSSPTSILPPFMQVSSSNLTAFVSQGLPLLESARGLLLAVLASLTIRKGPSVIPVLHRHGGMWRLEGDERGSKAFLLAASGNQGKDNEAAVEAAWQQVEACIQQVADCLLRLLAAVSEQESYWQAQGKCSRRRRFLSMLLRTGPATFFRAARGLAASPFLSLQSSRDPPSLNCSTSAPSTSCSPLDPIGAAAVAIKQRQLLLRLVKRQLSIALGEIYFLQRQHPATCSSSSSSKVVNAPLDESGSSSLSSLSHLKSLLSRTRAALAALEGDYALPIDLFPLQSSSSSSSSSSYTFVSSPLHSLSTAAVTVALSLSAGREAEKGTVGTRSGREGEGRAGRGRTGGEGGGTGGEGSTGRGPGSAEVASEAAERHATEGGEGAEGVEGLEEAAEKLRADAAAVEAFVTRLIRSCQKPSWLQRHWLELTAGGVGLAVAASWAARHSAITGSSDFERWIKAAKISTVRFFDEHAWRPLLAIRDDVFETFQRQPKAILAADDVKISADSLHRMLSTFIAAIPPEELSTANQTSSLGTERGAEDQSPLSWQGGAAAKDGVENERGSVESGRESERESEMMAVVMRRYEKEMKQPLRGAIRGQLVQAMLIQVQKLKLDVETAMLQLDQILRSNQINFAVLSALPLLFVAYAASAISSRFFASKARGGAEGRGRAAQTFRRMALRHVETILLAWKDASLQLQTSGASAEVMQEEDRECMGQLVFSLFNLSIATHAPSLRSGEWESLRDDILLLASPFLILETKLLVIARMERVYECLAPIPRPSLVLA